jgi:hypothetical protein
MSTVATLRKAFVTVVVIAILTIAFVALQDVPEVRRFTDQAVRTVSLVGLALFVLGLIFVIGHRLGASTERSQVAPNQTYTSTAPPTYTPAMPQILMLPPAQSNLPREVWERPLSSNQSQSTLETSTPRKVDWSIVS